MEPHKKRRSMFGSLAIALAVVLIGFAFALALFFGLTATVSGTASLPNGITARINGPFDCSEVAGITTIEAGGHTFMFTPTTISVDGVAVSPLDASITNVQVTASSWPASLRINGKMISVPK